MRQPLSAFLTAFMGLLVVLAALFWAAGPGQAKKIIGSHDGLERCGNDVIMTRACPTCDTDPAFELDGYWHKLAQCTRDIRDLWKKHGPLHVLSALPGAPSVADLARAEIVQEMTRAHVVFVVTERTLPFDEVFDATLAPRRAFSHVYLSNDLGVAYNGMGQSGLAHYMYHLAALADEGGYDDARSDAAFYRALARGAINTVLTPTDEGGLASSTACALAPAQTCTWYHSITRRDRPGAAGGTLNQMLHVVRDLEAIDRLARKQGWSEPFDFIAGADAGLNQMFLAAPYAGRTTLPTLSDFISDEVGPNGAAWAYYGFSLSGNRAHPGYFLKNREKNCSYHIHVLQLLETAMERAAQTGDADAALARAFDPATGLVEFIHAAQDSEYGRVSSRISCAGKSLRAAPRIKNDLLRLQRKLPSGN